MPSASWPGSASDIHSGDNTRMALLQLHTAIRADVAATSCQRRQGGGNMPASLDSTTLADVLGRLWREHHDALVTGAGGELSIARRDALPEDDVLRTLIERRRAFPLSSVRTLLNDIRTTEYRRSTRVSTMLQLLGGLLDEAARPKWLNKLNKVLEGVNTNDRVAPCPVCRDLMLVKKDAIGRLLGVQGGGVALLERGNPLEWVCGNCFHLRNGLMCRARQGDGLEDDTRILRAISVGDLIHNYSYDVLQNIDPIHLKVEEGGARRPFYMGVELEVAAVNLEYGSQTFWNTVRTAQELLPHCVFKEDGSVRDTDDGPGFEIVSAPCTLAVHRMAWRPWFEQMAHAGVFSGPRQCGLHVHLDRAVIEPLTLGKLMRFIHARHNRTLVTGLAGRSDNHYAQLLDDKKIKDFMRVNDVRYEAVNLQRGRTAEIRLFASTNRYEVFMQRLEFCHSAVSFCREASARDVDNKGKESCEKLYLQFLRKHRSVYPELFKRFWPGEVKAININKVKRAS